MGRPAAARSARCPDCAAGMYDTKTLRSNKMEENRKYEEVYAELESLITRIEDPQRDLSTIGTDVRKAMALIAWCRNYIRGSQEEIEKLMKEETR